MRPVPDDTNGVGDPPWVRITLSPYRRFTYEEPTRNRPLDQHGIAAGPHPAGPVFRALGLPPLQDAELRDPVRRGVADLDAFGGPGGLLQRPPVHRDGDRRVADP